MELQTGIRPTISIARIKQLIGKEEYQRKTDEEWIRWEADLAVIIDTICESINDSKYQSIIENRQEEVDTGE